MTPRLAEGSRASAEIGPDGGTLTATGPDGATYSLVIPAGTLIAPTTITMTPLEAADGLPFSDGLVGGVQFEPEGLALFPAAQLLIRTARPAAGSGLETVAFGYHGTGGAIHLVAATVTGNEVSLPMRHFSGAGAARGTAAEISQVSSSPPADLGDRLEGPVEDVPDWGDSDALAKQVLEALADRGGRPTARSQFLEENLLQVYQDDLRKRLLEAKYAATLREGWTLVMGRWRQVIEEDHKDCLAASTTQPIGQIVLDALYVKFRQHPVFFKYAHDLAAALMPFVEGELRGCVRFELQFSSTIDDTNKGGKISVTAKTKAVSIPTLELTSWDYGKVTLEGKDKLNFPTKTASQTGFPKDVCPKVWELVPGPGSLVVKMTLTLTSDRSLNTAGMPRVSKVVLTVPRTPDDFLVGCKHGFQGVFGSFARFSTTFAIHRNGKPGQPITISDWDAGGYPTLAQNIRTAVERLIAPPAWKSKESTRLLIVHVPK